MFVPPAQRFSNKQIAPLRSLRWSQQLGPGRDPGALCRGPSTWEAHVSRTEARLWEPLEAASPLPCWALAGCCLVGSHVSPGWAWAGSTCTCVQFPQQPMTSCMSSLGSWLVLRLGWSCSMAGTWPGGLQPRPVLLGDHPLSVAPDLPDWSQGPWGGP